MEYRRFGSTVVARIDRGEEILAALQRIAEAEGIRLAEVSALARSTTSPWGSTTWRSRRISRTGSRGRLRSCR